MCAAKSEKSTAPVDLDKLFEATKAKIGPKLEYLNSIDDYCTSDARDAIRVLEIASYSLRKGGPNEKICERVVKYMKQLGIAKLIVKILTSVATNPEKIAYESYELTCLLKERLLVTIDSIALSRDIRLDLVKNGVINPLLDDLNSCDPNTKDPRQQVRILRSIYGLRNLSYPHIDIPSIIPAFRAARAVDILMKFIEVEDEFIKIRSLIGLASIMNEEEGNRLATSKGCIATMVRMLVEATDTNGREYSSKIKIDEETQRGFVSYVYVLAEGLNNLSSNNENKKAIIQHGGLPALSMLLRPTNMARKFESLEMQNAVGTLWKMSFLDECQKNIVTHLTFSDSTAFEGRALHFVLTPLLY